MDEWRDGHSDSNITPPCGVHLANQGWDPTVALSINSVEIALFSTSYLVSWCFEPSQPQRITSRLTIQHYPRPIFFVFLKQLSGEFQQSYRNSTKWHHHCIKDLYPQFSSNSHVRNFNRVSTNCWCGSLLNLLPQKRIHYTLSTFNVTQTPSYLNMSTAFPEMTEFLSASLTVCMPWVCQMLFSSEK